VAVGYNLIELGIGAVLMGAVAVLTAGAMFPLIFHVSAYVRRRIRMPGDRPTTPA
jgi:hypothetical protein